MNKDGGAAFPNVLVTVDKNGSQNFIVNNGMTMRQWYKGMAPADEIEGIMGNSIDSVSKFLGILSGNYDCNVHYPMAVARARGVWADAQLAEDAAREGEDADDNI